MAMMKITTVPLYLSSQAGVIVAVIGAILLLRGFVSHRIHHRLVRNKIFVRGGSLLLVLIVIKTPLMLWRSSSLGTELG